MTPKERTLDCMEREYRRLRRVAKFWDDKQKQESNATQQATNAAREQAADQRPETSGLTGGPKAD